MGEGSLFLAKFSSFSLKKFKKIKKIFFFSFSKVGALFSIIFSSSSSCKKEEKRKNILLLLLEGGSLFSSKFLLIPVNKEEIINKYSSSPSLRVVLYFQLYFLLLHVKKNKINK